MKALDWVETFEKTNPRFWLVWLPDHISMHYEYMGLPYTTSLGRVDYGEVAIYWMNMS